MKTNNNTLSCYSLEEISINANYLFVHQLWIDNEIVDSEFLKLQKVFIKWRNTHDYSYAVTFNDLFILLMKDLNA